MTLEECRARTRQFILETFLFSEDPDDLPDDASLTGEGILDSMGALELVTFLEGTFGIAIGNDEVLPENLDTVDRIAAFVTAKQAAGAATAAQ